ncbi:MAG: hypothetical protein ACOYNL_01000 [Rickettsiales bacterium]
MTEYMRSAKADECAIEAKQLIETLFAGKPIKIKPALVELDAIQPSPFTPGMEFIRPPVGTITGGGAAMSLQGSVMAGLAAQIIKPYYDNCMGGTPTFLPKKTGAAPGK